jgi:ankyrin repeat protein
MKTPAPNKRPQDAELLRAMATFDIPAMRAALAAGANANLRMDDAGRTPLMHMAGLSWYDRISAVHLLLECGADVHLADRQGRTALHVAAASPVWKSEEVLRALLDAGADIDAADAGGNRPLHLAVRCWVKDEQPFVLLALLERGADLQARNRKGKTPPDIAIDSREMPEGKQKMREMFNRYAEKQAARREALQQRKQQERALLRAKSKNPGLKLKK